MKEPFRQRGNESLTDACANSPGCSKVVSGLRTPLHGSVTRRPSGPAASCAELKRIVCSLSAPCQQAADMKKSKPTQTIQEKAYLYLRGKILSGELAPGVGLSEASIARELGNSRGPLREAVRRLTAEGL